MAIRFWLQGTFPPKSHITRKTKPYQQRLSLGLPVNMVGLQQAERQAKLIGAELSLGQFSCNRSTVAAAD